MDFISDIELPEVVTVVEFDGQSLINIGLVVFLTTIAIIFAIRYAK